MTQVKWFDCSCEDYPCCGHYDIIYGDENEPQFCDRCGGYHSFDLDCDYEDEDEDEVDEDDDGDPVELNDDFPMSMEYDDDTPLADYYGG
jgi:hypothetical protein